MKTFQLDVNITAKTDLPAIPLWPRNMKTAPQGIKFQLYHQYGPLGNILNFPHFLKLAQNPFSHPCTKLSNSTGYVPSLPKVLQFPAHPLSWGPSGSSQLVRLAKPSCLTAYFIPGLLVSRFLATGYSMPFASS